MYPKMLFFLVGRFSFEKAKRCSDGFWTHTCSVRVNPSTGSSTFLCKFCYINKTILFHCFFYILFFFPKFLFANLYGNVGICKSNRDVTPRLFFKNRPMFCGSFAFETVLHMTPNACRALFDPI